MLHYFWSSQMPRYDFKCDKCSKTVEIQIPADEVIHNPKWNEVSCVTCQELMYVVFSAEHMPGVHWKGKEAPLGMQSKNKREAEKVEEIYREGFRSNTEREDCEGFAKEYEKSQGKTPGALSGGVKAPTSKEEKAKIRDRDKKRREESVNKRRKVI